MSETAQSLSLERKIKMHEARESIIERLASGSATTINLDRFLGVIVSELGRMMDVDRCDIIQLTGDSELRISHEWRAEDDIPSSLGTAIPLDLKEIRISSTSPSQSGWTTPLTGGWLTKCGFWRRVSARVHCWSYR